jgi:hypothetical protein
LREADLAAFFGCYELVSCDEDCFGVVFDPYSGLAEVGLFHIYDRPVWLGSDVKEEVAILLTMSMREVTMPEAFM